MTPEESARGKTACHFVMMSHSVSNFGSLTEREDWKLLEGRADATPWSDDYSNIISVLKW